MKGRLRFNKRKNSPRAGKSRKKNISFDGFLQMRRKGGKMGVKGGGIFWGGGTPASINPF